MADTKISGLSALSSANITATDAIPIVDDMSGTPATYRGSVNDLRGSWEFVASVEDSDVAALEITDIPTGFDLHRLTIPWMTFETDSVYPRLRVSSDNGSTYESASYDTRGGMDATESRTFGISLSLATNGFHMGSTSSNFLGNDTEEGFHFQAVLIGLTAAAYTKCFGHGMGNHTDTSLRGLSNRGWHTSATAMDAIQLAATSDNISGRMVLEGYRY